VIRSWIKNDPRSLCLKVLSTCARTNWSVGGVRPPSNVLYACIIQPLSVHLIHRRPVHSPGLRACLRDVMLAQPIQYWDWIEGSGWGWGVRGGQLTTRTTHAKGSGQMNLVIGIHKIHDTTYISGTNSCQSMAKWPWLEANVCGTTSNLTDLSSTH
jgi:hypothetical protein